MIFVFISLFAIKIKFGLKNQLNLRVSFVIIPLSIKPMGINAKTILNTFVKKWNFN